MKKSIVALLVALALVVLISPGIVGRLAERSVEQSLEWAAEESGEVSVAAERFDRGWFSSQGRHRLEILDPARQAMLDELLGDAAGNGTPSLVIDTRLDHGLVPVSSMVRDKGTLMPGLGSAVSTFAIEYPDGTSFAVPGTVYSRVGLTGVYTANYVVDAGTHTAGSSAADWGAADLRVSIDPRSGRSFGDGSVGSLDVVSDGDRLLLGQVEFTFDRLPGRSGIAVGDAGVRFESLSVTSPVQPPVTAGPVSIHVSAAENDDRLDGTFELELAGVPVEGYGDMRMNLAMRYAGIDAAALADLMQRLDSVDDNASAGEALAVAQDDVARVLAAGFTVHVDHLDFVLPQGDVRTTMRFTFDEADPTDFTWTSALLTLDAEADLAVSEPFADFAMSANPQAGVLIGMGYLKKQGDDYVMHAEYRKGLLAINGAPMPVPLSP